MLKLKTNFCILCDQGDHIMQGHPKKPSCKNMHISSWW